MLSDLRMIGVWSLALVFCLALGQAVGDEAKPKVKTGTLIIECDGLFELLFCKFIFLLIRIKYAKVKVRFWGIG